MSESTPEELLFDRLRQLRGPAPGWYHEAVNKIVAEALHAEFSRARLAGWREAREACLRIARQREEAAITDCCCDATCEIADAIDALTPTVPAPKPAEPA